MRMIEKVARAMANEQGTDWDSIQANGPGSGLQKMYTSLAIVAIGAMRAPTDFMEKAAYNYDDSGAQLSCAYDEIYTVMIDAALNE